MSNIKEDSTDLPNAQQLLSYIRAVHHEEPQKQAREKIAILLSELERHARGRQSKIDHLERHWEGNAIDLKKAVSNLEEAHKSDIKDKVTALENEYKSHETARYIRDTNIAVMEKQEKRLRELQALDGSTETDAGERQEEIDILTAKLQDKRSMMGIESKIDHEADAETSNLESSAPFDIANEKDDDGQDKNIRAWINDLHQS